MKKKSELLKKEKMMKKMSLSLSLLCFNAFYAHVEIFHKGNLILRR